MRSGKYLDPADLGRRLVRDREEGRRVALANGCFSLFHVGHVRYLEASAQTADRLVVALNSDASIRDIKGPGKVILDEEARVMIISALSCVDYVTLFDHPRVDRVLEQLRPDVHCKGGDYRSPREVPEYGTVQAYGGETRIVGGAKIRSTSDILVRIMES